MLTAALNSANVSSIISPTNMPLPPPAAGVSYNRVPCNYAAASSTQRCIQRLPNGQPIASAVMLPAFNLVQNLVQPGMIAPQQQIVQSNFVVQPHQQPVAVRTTLGGSLPMQNTFMPQHYNALGNTCLPFFPPARGKSTRHNIVYERRFACEFILRVFNAVRQKSVSLVEVSFCIQI